nr:conserved uncharacterized protein [uncultured bacterium]
MKRLIPIGLPVVLLLAFMMALPLLAAETALMVHDPWIREAPPVAQTQAGYMMIHNGSGKEVSIVSATSPAFAKVEMHETVTTKEGMSTMKAMERMTVQPGGQLTLAPGGYHLMLIAPVKALKSKDKVPLTLKLEDGSLVQVEAEVRAPQGGKSEATQDHHHNH